MSRNGLAKTSASPGKTQLINHFVINDNWYLVDLPGYGYAKVSKVARAEWGRMINFYLRHRANLMCVCVLLDSRHAPQAADLAFMEQLGDEGIPFVMVFTKADKQSTAQTKALLPDYLRKMSETWDELPRYFHNLGRNRPGPRRGAGLYCRSKPGSGRRCRRRVRRLALKLPTAPRPSGPFLPSF